MKMVFQFCYGFEAVKCQTQMMYSGKRKGSKLHFGCVIGSEKVLVNIISVMKIFEQKYLKKTELQKRT